MPICQRQTNFSPWRVNVPKVALNFQLRLPEGVLIFKLIFKRILQFSNFLIMLNISKYQEYLSYSNLSRETKNLDFDISKISLTKTLSTKTFDVVYNGAHGIN